jgi:predicted GIY-YIG superfamily endonuclease
MIFDVCMTIEAAKQRDLRASTEFIGWSTSSSFDDIRQAIAREQAAQGWLRTRKIQLIESVNPSWNDLSLEWLPDK